MTEEKQPAGVQRWQINAVIALLTILVLFAAAFAADTWLRPKFEPRWEYAIQKVPDTSFVETMNRAGIDGWELVSSRRASDAPLVENPVYYYEMIFRRQIGPNRLPVKGP